jgi:hypothetical protein
MVEKVADRRYLASVRRYVRRRGAVLWIAKACIKGYYTEQESCVSDNRNQRGKDVVVPDPGHKREFWHNGGYHVISIVVGLYSLAVPHGQDFMC